MFLSQIVILGLSQTSVSKNVRIRVLWGIKKEKRNRYIWKCFLRKVEACLKLPLQTIFFKNICSQVVVFSLSQTGYNKNDKIRVFCGVTKK